MDSNEENAGADRSDKLIPEWGRNADDQVLLAGIVVAVLFFGILGWNTFFGGDDAADDVAAAITTTDDGNDSADTTVNSGNSANQPADVQSAVDGLAGDISGTETGGVALLEGFVANEGERTDAETAALGVSGIDSVDNKLKLLEPAVVESLKANDVESPTASGTGTVLTVTGTIESEDKRAPVLKSASEVPGVTDIVDQLTVAAQTEPDTSPEEVDDQVADITDQLNQLPQVQFDYNSATISAASFADLDEAAVLLSEIDENYEGTIEVQGYTDTTGDAARNQALSEERSKAVMDYLIEQEVPETLLVSKGYGPTTEFGPDLDDNRRVQFEPVE